MLLGELLESLLGLVSTDEVIHVSDVGEDTAAGTADLPLKRIAKALENAAALPAGQRLVIQLQGTRPFRETVTLPSNVTIAGPGTIEAASAGPAVIIEGTAAAPRTGVVLRDLQLVGLAPFGGLGGAVRVRNANDVRLEGCVLRDSRAGRGGGVAILESAGVVLERCTLRENRAGDAVPEVDIAPPPLELPGGDGHGGGAFVRDSDVRFDRCDVLDNRAIFAGGGIAVANVTRPEALVEIDDCEITLNQVSHQPLTLLGPSWSTIAPPVARDMGDPIRARFTDTLLSETQELDVLSLAHGLNYESGLGGGVAARNTRDGPVIRRCRIGITRAGAAAPNIARRGGGIHMYTGANARVEDCTIAYNAASGDGGGIGGDFFDPFMPNGETRFGIAAITMIPRRPIVLIRNEFRENQSIEDGGGLYVTGNARPQITGGLFIDNRAGEHGGGIRATYASRLRAVGVRFERNRANVFTVEAAGDKEGGGAVSARNSDVHLEDCELVLNRVFEFAGGAIYYRSSFEGGATATGLQADVHHLFDDIQETAFGYRTRTLRIVNCRAEDDRALGTRGAGGFLYALRSPEVVSAEERHGGQEPMWVSIEGARTDLKACTSEHDRGGTVGTRKRGTVVIELSGNVTGGIPDDRVSIGREVGPGAIAPSIPATDARALVVMPDAIQANDIRHPLFAGGPFVFGPTPTLAAVDKTIVPAAGGAAVRATGTRFETGMEVRVGGAPGTVTGVTATSIDFTAPPGPPGRHDVEVRLPSGAQAWLTGALQLVRAPEVTYMSRLKAPAGAAITMRGSGLPIGTRVHFLFAASEVEATVTTHDHDDELVFTVPAAPAGQTTARVRVTSPTGQQFTRPLGKTFEYLP